MSVFPRLFLVYRVFGYHVFGRFSVRGVQKPEKKLGLGFSDLAQGAPKNKIVESDAYLPDSR
jgi:hypothetical protein